MRVGSHRIFAHLRHGGCRVDGAGAKAGNTRWPLAPGLTTGIMPNRKSAGPPLVAPAAEKPLLRACDLGARKVSHQP